MKLYTKKGDKGETSLIGGQRVLKDHLRIEAYGTIDELNSHIGLVHDIMPDDTHKPLLNTVQNTLFVIGSNLAATPESKMEIPNLEEREVLDLEKAIDDMESELPALTNFILPGGHSAVSSVHIARCVCRRAERECVRLSQHVEIDDSIIPYLNRLSDYLFVLARDTARRLNVTEITWKGIRN